MIIEIDRARWGRRYLLRAMDSFFPNGRDAYNEEEHEPGNAIGSMCCLGFACLAHGVPESAIKGVAHPSTCRAATILPAWLKEVSFGGQYYHTDSEKLASLNDSFFGTAETEARITEIFDRHGDEVRFVGKFPPGRVPEGCAEDAK